MGDHDAGDHRGRRRTARWAWVFVGLAMLVASEVWFLLARDGSPAGSARPVATNPPVTAPDPDAAPAAPVAPAVAGLADSGTDYSGDALPVLAQRTTAAGVHLSLRDMSTAAGAVPAAAVPPAAVPPVEAMAAVVPGAANVVVWRRDDVTMQITRTDFNGNQVTLDVMAGGVGMGPAPPGAGPAWCWPRGSYRLSGVYDGAVSVASGALYPDGAPGVRAALHFAGQADGTPFRLLVVQPPQGTTAVEVRFGDGASDIAPVSSGVAVLATPGEPSGEFTLTLKRDHVRVPVAWREVIRDGDARWSRACNPAVSLPAPGAEQPRDADAARNQIRDQFAVLFQSKRPVAERVAALDDIDGVVDAIDALRGTSGAAMFDDAAYVLDDIVFASPTTAWFSYAGSVGGTMLGARFGQATLIDGTWKITRATICQDVSMAGGACQPWSDPVFPP